MSELQVIPFKLGDELNGPAEDSIMELDLSTMMSIPPWRTAGSGSTKWVIKYGENAQDETDVLTGVLLKVFYYHVRYPEGSDLGVPPEFISLEDDGDARTTKRCRLVLLAEDTNLPFVIDLAPTSLFALSQFTIRVNQGKGMSLANVVSEFRLVRRNVKTTENGREKTFPVGSVAITPIGVVSPETVQELKTLREGFVKLPVAFIKDFERSLNAIESPRSSKSSVEVDPSDDPFNDKFGQDSGASDSSAS